MSEWQPIETAPKDGTRFLAFWPSTNPPNVNSTIVTTWWGMYTWETAFITAGDDDLPTHWMPLPSPPEGKT